MNTHTTEQLLMCEKADLVKYIEELKYDKWYVCETLATAVASRLSSWMPDELMEGVDFAEDVDMSKVDGDALVKMIDGYTKCCIKNETEELKKWSLSKDMIESTSAETIEEFEKDVRDNWKELEELQNSIESISNEYMSGEETIDDIRDYIEQKTDEIVELKEENENLENMLGESYSKHDVYDLKEELKISAEQARVYGDKLLEKEDEIKKLKEELEWKKIDIQKEVQRVKKQVDELENLKKDNEKLKIDHSMNTQYWRCYLSYTDPRCDMYPEKEHIDDWCKNGDVVDEKLKEYLYHSFCIEEEEDE